MSEIHYKEAAGYISGLAENAFATVFLIYGEEYLYKSVFESLLDKMVPKEKNYYNENLYVKYWKNWS